MPCDESVCPGTPRTQTAYLWRATVNNIDLCYSFEVCGGVDFFTGTAKACLDSGAFYLDDVCKCALGEHMMIKNGVQACTIVRVADYDRNTSRPYRNTSK